MATEEVVRSLVRDLQPVRRLRGVQSRARLWATFALSCVFLGAWALGPRADLPMKIGDPGYLGGSALLLSIFALSARSAFHLSVPGAERAPGARALPILGLLLWATLLATGASAGTGGSLSAADGWPCVWRMTCLALTPTLAALIMLRKGAPLSPGWTGWFALLSTSSLAILGTQALCAKDDPRHLFLWHLGPLLAASLTGVHLGRWFFRPARSAPAPR